MSVQKKLASCTCLQDEPAVDCSELVFEQNIALDFLLITVLMLNITAEL